jgi:hypothetical protein
MKSGISNFRFVIAMLLLIAGCAHERPTPGRKSPDSFSSRRTPTTQPILYHRTGGIAGTDDRVVIWPDGFVEVNGKVLPDASARVPADRLGHLASMFAGWDRLRDEYLVSNVADAYTITIHYGGKTVTASDLEPDLPDQFRRVFTEIESIAAGAESTEPKPAP